MEQTKGLNVFLKSMRCRLIILLILVTVIPGIFSFTAIVHAYEVRAVSLRQSEVLGQAKILANQIATNESVHNEDLEAKISMLTSMYNGRVVVVDSCFRVVRDTYNLDMGRTVISKEVIESFAGADNIFYDRENAYLDMTIPIHRENAEIEGVLLVSVSLDSVALTKTYLTQISMIIIVIMAVLCLFGGILAILKFTSPVRKLRQRVDEVSEGIGSDIIRVDDCSESRMLSDSVNHLVDRMRIMDQSRQEFVANVSHELKTPMTSIKVLADTINCMPDAPIELYQEFMADITSEIERENKIINDLLALVKMDKSASQLNISKVTINNLLEQTLKRLQPIAEQQKVQLVLESFRPVVAEVDEVKLTLALTNLVENAIKYNHEDGSGYVHVSLNSDYKYFYIKVEDNGIGMPEESLGHIYERFYRVEKSHSREIGGTGLGLAITKSAIQMHRGIIKVHSELGEGTTFDVRIPLNYIPN